MIVMSLENQRVAEAYEVQLLNEHFKHELFGTSDAVRSFCIMTAENPLEIKLGREENKSLNKELESSLKSGRFVFRHVNGFYGATEHSYMILNITLSAAKRLAAMFNQQSFIYAFKSDHTNNTRKPKMTYKFYALRNTVISRCIAEYKRTGKFPSIPENAYVATDIQNELEFPDSQMEFHSRKNDFKFRIPFGAFVAESADFEDSVVAEYEAMRQRIGNERFTRLLGESMDDSRTCKYQYQCRSSLMCQNVFDSSLQ